MFRALARGVGELLLTSGALLLLFSAYLVWGTGAYTEQAQDDLLAELSPSLPAAAAPADPSAPSSPASPDAPGAAPSAPTTEPGTGPATLPPPSSPRLDLRAPEGSALLKIEIPRIGLTRAVVEGVSQRALRKGPGHYPGTPYPGQIGNVVISGHRTTYGAPFRQIDELEVGDAIVLTAPSGRFTYRVTELEVVRPSQNRVLLPVPNRPGVEPTQSVLTLTTCHPEYSARQRLVVRAVLEGS